MAPADTAEVPEHRAGMARYYQELERARLAPLWESLAALAPAEPSPKARPFKWAYGEVRAHLMEAGRLITAEEAERRVVVLANPGLDGALQATDTLYAGLQLILPGETAPPHRHSQSALRFVMEGQGAYTAVDGQKAWMRPGDFIVTPAMTWHEHGGGPEPVIWMDGLDVPLVGFLNAGFREEPRGHPLPSQSDPPTFAWPYDQARQALEQARHGLAVNPWLGYRMKYRNAQGDWPMPTLGTTLTLLPAGFASRPYRSIDSSVLTLVEGRVIVRAGGESFELGPRDVFSLPGWTEVRFEAVEESVVFGFSDRPVYEALGLWREELGG
jgi:gentisate 1,2-dioxygenase